MEARRFFVAFAATIVVLAALTAVLSIVVDPYRMYGTAPVPGLTALKPRIYEETGIAKTTQLERVRPVTLLLGNSRVEIGLDPSSSAWPVADRPVFDAAESGKDLFVAWRMLQEAIAVRPPRTVVVGLDIIDFLSTRPEGDPDPPVRADDRRLLVARDGRPNPARPIQLWRDRLTTTLTIGALTDSLVTLVEQSPDATTMTAEGFNPLNEYRLFVARSGYRELFDQKNAIYEAQYRLYRKPDFTGTATNAGLLDLERIVATAGAHDIPLVLYIHPYHADYLEMLHRLGLWQSFEDWKRVLVRIVDAANRERPHAIRLVDFSDYDRYSTEPVPPAGDTHSTMRWYWEPGHYKPALGDRIIERLFDSSRDTATWGRDLDSETVEADIDQTRQHRDAYLASIKPLRPPVAAGLAKD